MKYLKYFENIREFEDDKLHKKISLSEFNQFSSENEKENLSDREIKILEDSWRNTQDLEFASNSFFSKEIPYRISFWTDEVDVDIFKYEDEYFTIRISKNYDFLGDDELGDRYSDTRRYLCDTIDGVIKALNSDIV
jgi:hypothetical protein